MNIDEMECHTRKSDQAYRDNVTLCLGSNDITNVVTMHCLFACDLKDCAFAADQRGGRMGDLKVMYFHSRTITGRDSLTFDPDPC